MKDLGANLAQLKVAIGPSIGPCHFEVGNDVAEELCKDEGLGSKKILLGKISLEHPDPEKKFINLAELSRHRLTLLGVAKENILLQNPCTFCDPKNYFSYRRNREEKGRLESVIIRAT
jgi:copper oxidase (laccase) domain-containing protein